MQDTRIHHERYPLNNAKNVKWAQENVDDRTMPQAGLIIKMQVSDRHVTIDILKVLKPEGGKTSSMLHS